MRLTKILMGVALSFLLVTEAGATFTNIYAFGDSLSDNGNLYDLVLAATGGSSKVPPPPYFEGRASNGPVAVEYLAHRLGLDLQPLYLPNGSLSPHGNNFSVIGAATGAITQQNGNNYRNYLPFSRDPRLPDVGMAEEVGLYLSPLVANGVADPHALYFLWGGANDAYIALEDPAIDHDNATVMNTTATATALQAAANITTYIGALKAAGAHNFLIPNLPDLGRTPDAVFFPVGSAYADALTLYSDTFNTALTHALTDPTLAGLDIVQFDVASLFDQFLASAGINTTTACIWNLSNCDPATTLFWDGVHPTTTYHRLLGLAMANAVPEPDVSAVLLASLLLLSGILSARWLLHTRGRGSV